MLIYFLDARGPYLIFLWDAKYFSCKEIADVFQRGKS